MRSHFVIFAWTMPKWWIQINMHYISLYSVGNLLCAVVDESTEQEGNTPIATHTKTLTVQRLRISKIV